MIYQKLVYITFLNIVFIGCGSPSSFGSNTDINVNLQNNLSEVQDVNVSENIDFRDYLPMSNMTKHFKQHNILEDETGKYDLYEKIKEYDSWQTEILTHDNVVSYNHNESKFIIYDNIIVYQSDNSEYEKLYKRFLNIGDTIATNGNQKIVLKERVTEYSYDDYQYEGDMIVLLTTDSVTNIIGNTYEVYQKDIGMIFRLMTMRVEVQSCMDDATITNKNQCMWTVYNKSFYLP